MRVINKLPRKQKIIVNTKKEAAQHLSLLSLFTNIIDLYK